MKIGDAKPQGLKSAKKVENYFQIRTQAGCPKKKPALAVRLGKLTGVYSEVIE
jgi:hypothetical protein